MNVEGSPFSLRYAWAQGLYDRGDHHAAATALAQLVEEAKRSDVMHGTTDLRLLLARAYFRSAQLGRAEEVLRELAEEVPTDGYVHLVLGRTLQRQGRHEEARRSLALAAVLGDHARPLAFGEGEQ
ncbi:MAG TPA: tetratricopeptide repeat protein [Intrasporangium sp.]|uniref:tetratricopeptide repeat protein n=1 Tax=Intrasporangium sp. TaxID=1925024 RepID=UPI002D765C34|nr:tetratricopeptide repeat protein [Intrasporangium sp.]HET7397831.1 tetratricopeptide repeat protein [Intrasporangium sp.]